MDTVNFSRYYLNLKSIKMAFKELISRVLLYLVSSLILYYFAVVPAMNLIKHRRRVELFKERARFLRHLLVQIETHKRSLLQYHKYFIRRNFANFWQELWPFLEKSLPKNTWIESVTWEKRGKRFVLLISGSALVGEKNQDDLARSLNELVLAFPSSKLALYIKEVKLEEIVWDKKDKIFRYVLGFYPKVF